MLTLYLNRFTYFIELQRGDFRGGEKGKNRKAREERFSIHLFTHQMATMDRAGLSQNQEPGHFSWSSAWILELKHLSHPLLLSQGALAGRWDQKWCSQYKLAPICDAGITRGFTCFFTILALVNLL